MNRLLEQKSQRYSKSFWQGVMFALIQKYGHQARVKNVICLMELEKLAKEVC